MNICVKSVSIHQIFAEMFQSALKWWSNELNSVLVPRTFLDFVADGTPSMEAGFLADRHNDTVFLENKLNVGRVNKEIAIAIDGSLAI